MIFCHCVLFGWRSILKLILPHEKDKTRLTIGFCFGSSNVSKIKKRKGNLVLKMVVPKELTTLKYFLAHSVIMLMRFNYFLSFNFVFGTINCNFNSVSGTCCAS